VDKSNMKQTHNIRFKCDFVQRRALFSAPQAKR
jgi:hypothetical protein